jgi:hypothetical protein
MAKQAATKRTNRTPITPQQAKKLPAALRTRLAKNRPKK